jgi:hypothetical protein
MSQQPLETNLRNMGLNDPIAQEEMDRGSLHSHEDVEEDSASQSDGDDKPVTEIEQDDGVTRIEALCGWMDGWMDGLMRILTWQTSSSERVGVCTLFGARLVSLPMSTRSVVALPSTVRCESCEEGADE